MKETLTADASSNEAYRLLLDHLSRRTNVKVERLLEPSLIEASVHSYFLGNPFDIRIELSSEKTRTPIRLSFDFTMTYILSFFLWIFLQALMIALFGMMDTVLFGSWTTAVVLASGLRSTVRRTKESFLGQIASALDRSEPVEPLQASG
ncbi:MAG: hypothetical protein OEY99_00060 [Aigarchaeota archaeon]|nr:hypothetical protein [Aigarchaeota archaeon]MDH5702594.1 hypothetical protein [Aigarchaeota archaeon]